MSVWRGVHTTGNTTDGTHDSSQAPRQAREPRRKTVEQRGPGHVCIHQHQVEQFQTYLTFILKARKKQETLEERTLSQNCLIDSETFINMCSRLNNSLDEMFLSSRNNPWPISQRAIKWLDTSKVSRQKILNHERSVVTVVYD